MREVWPTTGLVVGLEMRGDRVEAFQERESIRAQELLREQVQRDEQTLVVPDREAGSGRGHGKLGLLLRAILRRQAR